LEEALSTSIKSELDRILKEALHYNNVVSFKRKTKYYYSTLAAIISDMRENKIIKFATIKKIACDFLGDNPQGFIMSLMVSTESFTISNELSAFLKSEGVILLTRSSVHCAENKTTISRYRHLHELEELQH
jgi:hypothetical protein